MLENAPHEKKDSIFSAMLWCSVNVSLAASDVAGRRWAHVVRARSWHASAEGRMSERFMLRMQEWAARLSHVLVRQRAVEMTHWGRHGAMLVVLRQWLRSRFRAERVVCVVISALVGTHRSLLVSERRAGASCNDHGLRREGDLRDRSRLENFGLLGDDG